jgi:hypothetical protein
MGDIMNDVLGRMWKDAVVAYFQVLFPNLAGCAEEDPETPKSA